MANKLNIQVQVDDKNLTDTKGTFSLQPLDRGYGITLGNSLRRVLFTCIPGAAITNVRIDVVQLSYSTLNYIYRQSLV